MAKEIENLQQLETQRDSLSKGIGRIRDVYLSDPIRIGKVEVGSSFIATLEVGRTKAAARIAITGLNNKLEQVDNELRANSEARDYIHRVNQMQGGLAEMRELVAEGNLPEDILGKHQQEFEELQKQRENNLLLQKAIERIKQEAKPLIEILPDGKVRLPNGKEVRGKRAELLAVLKDTSEDNIKRSDELATELYPGLDEEVARKKVTTALFQMGRELKGGGIEIVPKIPTAAEKAHGVKAGYFLKRVDQSEQPVELAQPSEREDKSDGEFRFEDVQVVTGEEGKILSKLSPFSPNHIVSRQELMQALSSQEAPVDSQNFDQHLKERVSDDFSH